MTNRTYPPGVPCWVDTEQSDVEAATAFYGRPRATERGCLLVDGVDVAGQDHIDVVKIGKRSRQLVDGLPAVNVQGHLHARGPGR